MDSSQSNPPHPLPENTPYTSSPNCTGQDDTAKEIPFMLTPSGLSLWAKNLKITQPTGSSEEKSAGAVKSTFTRFTSGLSLRLSPKDHPPEENVDNISTVTQPGVFGSLTKGLVDSSKNAVKAVSVKARHMVSQNKRRYQDGGFDLDMTYITENIIAMGFPAGDMSSGFLGYVEGFYRNHMEEVIKFFETHHKGKYKVYNLCSERLYDVSLFEGKVATFPFDDHNCPPIQLVALFCQSAYSWLKEDIENVVVVHCKAGMARTGLMISSLLLYLKFFPTAEESIDYYNQKRCLDGKGLVLPSQIRYVKYFERILTYFNGENQPGRRCMLRGFRLHKCPYWIRPSITVSDHNGVLFTTKKHPRTKDLMPEDFWFSAPKKGIMVFALPGEPGLTEVSGDFKIHFHDRQGDFYCWLNTTMMENRKTLHPTDLDGFDKRKLPSPGFQLEVVLIDYDGTMPSKHAASMATRNGTDQGSTTNFATADLTSSPQTVDKSSRSNNNKDDVFSDSDTDEPGSSSKSKRSHLTVESETQGKAPEIVIPEKNVETGVHQKDSMEQASIATKETKPESVVATEPLVFEAPKLDSTGPSEFKAIAADASVFSFGDEDDYDSE